MTSEVSKVLRQPRKMQGIFWKCCKSIAPATQNDFWHVMKHAGMRIKTSILRETSSDFTIHSVKIDVFLRVFWRIDIKIDVSCVASVDFHDTSQNATPATEFAPCHHLVQRWQCDSQKTRLKYCPCHTKWHCRSAKCCASHEKCNASSQNVAKVLRLPRKTIFDTSWNMLECHEAPRLPRETTLREAGKLERGHLLQNLP